MRYASITFDDGLINTAKRAVAESDHKFTFYVVTNWIDGIITPTDEYNRSLNHGTTLDWIDIAANGHEIGSHTVSHIRANTPNFLNECLESLRWLQTICLGPYTLSFPYGEVGPSTGFECRKGFEFASYTELGHHIHTIPSVNPIWDAKTKSLRPSSSIFKYIENLPDNHWLTITLHGIDEGWGKIRMVDFHSIIDRLHKEDIVIKPVQEIIKDNALRLCNNNVQST